MKVLRNIWGQLHRFVFWALILALFWSWIYTFVGDAPREKKLMLYVDAYALDQRGLSLRLEEEGLAEGIKMIQVRSFGYDLFSSELNGDLYLMKESILRATLTDTPGKLAPIQIPEGEQGYTWQGSAYGILAFDVSTQQGPAMDYIQYTPLPEPEKENYYLCFDANSPHLASACGAVDNAAWALALTFLKLGK